MNRLVQKICSAAAVVAQCHAAMAGSPPATSWELAGEFNTGPAFAGAVWSYGWKPYNDFKNFGAPMVPYAVAGTPLLGWKHPSSQAIPYVLQNQNLAPWTASPTGFGLTYPARGVVMHPGPYCEMATVRFTPPIPGLYRVSGQFFVLDANAQGTHTVVEVNRVQPQTPTGMGLLPMFLANLTQPTQAQQPFTSRAVMLGANDKIDFDVRCGANANYNYGSTGLHAVVERIGDYCTGVGDQSTC